MQQPVERVETSTQVDNLTLLVGQRQELLHQNVVGTHSSKITCAAWKSAESKISVISALVMKGACVELTIHCA